MRGTDDQVGEQTSHVRFIPAHAGNGSRDLAIVSAMAVHPRTCGERNVACTLLAVATGSSPHMRGTELQSDSGHGVHRFIPAHAGNGCNPTSMRSRATVHPRTCGERAHAEDVSAGRDGSSPHMRGTGLPLRSQGRARRFIPAHAGNGHDVTSAGRGETVHPRTCGERVVLA